MDTSGSPATNITKAAHGGDHSHRDIGYWQQWQERAATWKNTYTFVDSGAADPLCPKEFSPTHAAMAMNAYNL